MPKKIEANGKVFEFDDNATDEQIGSALDEYFSSNPTEVKKKEPTQSSFLGGTLGSQKPNQVVQPNVGVPSKPKASNTFEESISSAFGTLPSDSIKLQDSVKQIDLEQNDRQKMANSKPNVQALPLPPNQQQGLPTEDALVPKVQTPEANPMTSKEKKQYGLLQQRENYQEPILEGLSEVDKIQSKIDFLNNQKELKKDDFSFVGRNNVPFDTKKGISLPQNNKKVESLTREQTLENAMPKEYYNISLGGKGSVKLGELKPNVDENEQLLAAMYHNPKAPKEFKESFVDNRDKYLSILEALPENERKVIKNSLEAGVFDQYKQYALESSFFDKSAATLSKDAQILKDRASIQQQIGDVEGLQSTANQLADIKGEYKQIVDANKNVLAKYPEVMEKQAKDIATKEVFKSLNFAEKLGITTAEGLVDSGKSVLEGGLSVARLVTLLQNTEDKREQSNLVLNNITDNIERFYLNKPKTNDEWDTWQEVVKMGGEMYMFYGGGGAAGLLESAGAGKNASQFGAAFAHMYNGNVKANMELGLSSDDATTLGIIQTVATASVAPMFPESKLFDWSNPDNTYKILNEVVRGSKGEFGKRLANYLKDVSKEALEELTEDKVTTIAQNAYSAYSDKPQLLKDLFDIDGDLQTIKMSTIVSGLVSSPKLFNRSKLDIDKGHVYLAEDFDKFTQTLDAQLQSGYINEEQAAKVLDDVMQTKEALTKLPPNISFDNKSKLAPLIVFKSDLTTQNEQIAQSIVANEQSGLDEVIIANENKKLKEQLGVNEKQIKEINKNIEKIYESDKANQAAPSETNPSGDRDVRSEDKGEAEAVGVPTESATEPIGGQEDNIVQPLDEEIDSSKPIPSEEVKAEEVVVEKPTDQVVEVNEMVSETPSVDKLSTEETKPTNPKVERVKDLLGKGKEKVESTNTTDSKYPEKSVVKNGDQVKLPSMMKGGLERTIEYNDGKWKQRVGRELTEVSERVQKEAQDKFETNQLNNNNNATKKGNIEKSNQSEYQDRNEGGSTSKTSDSNSNVESGEKQKEKVTQPQTQKADVQETGTDKKSEQPQTEKPIVAETTINKIISSAVVEGQKLKDPTLSAAEKKKAKVELGKILSNNPSVKRIFDNIKEVHKQLVKNNVITKEGDCP